LLQLLATQKVKLHLAKRVAYFGNTAQGVVVLIKTEVKRYGIKLMTQHAKISYQHDSSDGAFLNTILLKVIKQVRFYFFPVIRIFFRELKVIAVPEVKQVELVPANEDVLPYKFIKLIQIKTKHKEPVLKPVFHGLQPVVHHGAFINARMFHAGSSTLNSG
jgi:hypothetical protein